MEEESTLTHLPKSLCGEKKYCGEEKCNIKVRIAVLKLALALFMLTG